jgi:hypothetical protein
VWAAGCRGLAAARRRGKHGRAQRRALPMARRRPQSSCTTAHRPPLTTLAPPRQPHRAPRQGDAECSLERLHDMCEKQIVALVERASAGPGRKKDARGAAAAAKAGAYKGAGAAEEGSAAASEKAAAEKAAVRRPPAVLAALRLRCAPRPVAAPPAALASPPAPRHLPAPPAPHRLTATASPPRRPTTATATASPPHRHRLPGRR